MLAVQYCVLVLMCHDEHFGSLLGGPIAGRLRSPEDFYLSVRYRGWATTGSNSMVVDEEPTARRSRSSSLWGPMKSNARSALIDLVEAAAAEAGQWSQWSPPGGQEQCQLGRVRPVSGALHI